ncbi:hypothetical protein QOT17_010673 [Balamuthia mandrillaris]
MEEALQAVQGHGRHQRGLFWLTGCTQLADAMELMLLPFLAHFLPCTSSPSSFFTLSLLPSSSAASSSTSSSSTAPPSSLTLTLVSSSVFAGMLLGAWLGGFVSDRWGRRWGCRLSALCCGVFGLLSAFSPTYGGLLLCRFGVGVGLGSSPSGMVLYLEFLPTAKARGSQLLLFLTFFSAGAVLEVGLAWLMLSSRFETSGMMTTLEEAEGGAKDVWRGLLFASAVPAMVLLVAGWVALPESPRWLVQRGRRKEAEEVLRSVARVNGVSFSSGSSASASSEPLYLLSNDHRNTEEKEGEDAKITSRASSANSFNNTFHELRQLFSSTTLTRTTAVLCLVFFLMAVVYYALVLLSVNSVVNDDGNNNNSQHQEENEMKNVCAYLTDVEFLRVLFTNAAEFPGLLAAFFLLDRMGRKASISFFFSVVGLCTLILSFRPVASSSSSDIELLVDTMIVFVARASSLAFNQSLWVYTAEVYPTTVRTTGLGFTTAFARIGGILSPFVGQVLFAASRRMSLLLCSLGSFTAAAAVLTLLPYETHDCALPDSLLDLPSPPSLAEENAQKTKIVNNTLLSIKRNV